MLARSFLVITEGRTFSYSLSLAQDRCNKAAETVRNYAFKLPASHDDGTMDMSNLQRSKYYVLTPLNEMISKRR